MKHIKNEEAVSPVIGVILMVVITVIIAAILAVFSFGIGGPAKAPEVNLKYSAVDNATNVSLKITHEGGDALILKDEKITITFAADGSDASLSPASPPQSLQMDNSSSGWQTTTSRGTLAAGQVIIGGLNSGAVTGTILEVKIVDTPTGQLISKARVVVQ